ncbi:MAG TPA: dienelactone hydrolase [Janthinobacterium sp.]|jgi:predicted dienelactone hydrolase|nr:dienelactone hydrolase [Janthinobacterium sp.]
MLTKMLVPALLALACLTAVPVQAQDNHIDTVRPDAPALAPYGTFSIGVETLQLLHPRQLDLVHAKAGAPIPVYDRPLTVEVWYPAKAAAAPSAPGAAAGAYRVMTRDGKTEATLFGKASRGAAPDASAGPYPLIIISHGYPGNRYLLGDLGENLASKGYVVVSIDHTDSTYGDQGAFASTLLNRPLDQLFVLNEMARLNRADPSGVLKGMVDADDTGLIGYSMGGYGVLNTIGAGFSAASVASPQGVPDGALAVRQAGNPAYIASMDQRIKAAMAFAPWGWNRGFWDAAGLAGVRTPVFFVAGSVDDVAGYAPGVRNLFEGSVNAPRFLLTFENANHNAGAPIPAPKETWIPSGPQKTITAGHYADAVWDSVRMNNIAEHFATAFLGKYLKNDAAMDPYLSLVEHASDGKWSVDANGAFNSNHTYWKGFANRSAAGLKLERRSAQ